MIFNLTIGGGSGGGSGSGSLQTKSVTPTNLEQLIEADSGYSALSAVIVGAIPTETVTVKSTAEEQIIYPSVGKYADMIIVQSVAESGGGSVEGGYTVTFMSEGLQYAVSSVTPGQVINRPTAPTTAGKYFSGWYTAETAGLKIDFPYTPTGNITLYAHFSEQIVVGVTGLTNEDGTLTLTDNIVGLEGYTQSQNGEYVSVISPLSEYFPFNEIEEFTDDSGNVFVKFPKLWMKWEVNDSGVITGYKFSNGQADDEYFIPDAFLDPTYLTQDTYLPYFALGKYEMSGSTSKGYSKSGATCLVNVTRANARSAARAYGSASNLYNGYQQLDFAQFTLYNLLCMMFYQHSNIQKVYGGRTGSGTVTSWSGASVTGTCDGLIGMNGWNTSTDCVKMSVIKSNRSESEMEFIHTARQLQIYSIQKCVGFPKRYTFYVSQPIADMATKIHDYVKCANSVYPLSQHEVQIRRDYLLRANAQLNSLVSQLEVAAELFGIEPDTMQYWMQIVEKEIRLVKAVLKKDKERYRDLP